MSCDLISRHSSHRKESFTFLLNERKEDIEQNVQHFTLHLTSVLQPTWSTAFNIL
ncbi:hypothetical protein J6590_101240 [Homalodisca vitripennis]|nr:hypothetical protein J6590_101240 [Homalodisca vitripennis]